MMLYSICWCLIPGLLCLTSEHCNQSLSKIILHQSQTLPLMGLSLSLLFFFSFAWRRVVHIVWIQSSNVQRTNLNLNGDVEISTPWWLMVNNQFQSHIEHTLRSLKPKLFIAIRQFFRMSVFAKSFMSVGWHDRIWNHRLHLSACAFS